MKTKERKVKWREEGREGRSLTRSVRRGNGGGRTARARWEGRTVCGGRRWSAVVRCKSPSTAFNYDVIANTDDGYFLRYTLYITRGPTTPVLKPKAVEALSLYMVLRTNDQAVWLFQDISEHNSIFAGGIKRFSFLLSLDPLFERSSRNRLFIFYWKNITMIIK